MMFNLLKKLGMDFKQTINWIKTTKVSLSWKKKIHLREQSQKFTRELSIREHLNWS